MLPHELDMWIPSATKKGSKKTCKSNHVYQVQYTHINSLACPQANSQIFKSWWVDKFTSCAVLYVVPDRWTSAYCCFMPSQLLTTTTTLITKQLLTTYTTTRLLTTIICHDTYPRIVSIFALILVHYEQIQSTCRFSELWTKIEQQNDERCPLTKWHLWMEIVNRNRLGLLSVVVSNCHAQKR